MKIKTQLTVLIFLLILFPVISILFVPVYHYLTSPRYHLLEGYDQLRAMELLDISEDDWSQLREYIKHLPPRVQAFVYYDQTVVFSCMPEFLPGERLSTDSLIDFIAKSSAEYDYMFLSPSINHSVHKISEVKRGPSNFLVVCRSSVPDGNTWYSFATILILFILVSVFEAVCLTIIISISRGLTKTVIVLDDSLKKITDGELDTKIVLPKTLASSSEFVSLSTSLDRLRLSLKDDQERRTKFIMGVSHDLRTPVALIKGYSEAVTDGLVHDKSSVLNSISIIHSKADQLEGMINELLNYEKLSSVDWREMLHKAPLLPVLEDYASLINSACSVYKRQCNVSLSVSPELEIPMDKNLVIRALENLFSNALRYTSEDDDISFTAVQNENDVVIKLSDSGQGISEEDLVRIWDIFFRGTNSRREQGSGIGLAVVKAIVETHGWKISVESVEKMGSTFIITIPLVPDVSKSHWSSRFVL